MMSMHTFLLFLLDLISAALPTFDDKSSFSPPFPDLGIGSARQKLEINLYLPLRIHLRSHRNVSFLSGQRLSPLSRGGVCPPSEGEED